MIGCEQTHRRRSDNELTENENTSFCLSFHLSFVGTGSNGFCGAIMDLLFLSFFSFFSEYPSNLQVLGLLKKIERALPLPVDL